MVILLFDKLLEELSERLVHIEKQYSYLSFLIEKRFANETLLRLEVMRIVSKMPEITEYLPEKLYGEDGKEKCDFWFKTSDSVEHWMEIKTRPTNYHKGNRGRRAITNGVDGVISDIERLRQKAPKEAKKHVLFAFYPLYPDRYEKFRHYHLRRISEALGIGISSPNMRIPVDDASFDVYLVHP